MTPSSPPRRSSDLRVHPLDLASYQARGHVTEPRPAIGFGDGRAEKPQGPKFQHDLAIKALVEIGACHERQKLVLRIVASRVTDHSLLLRELLVQPDSNERFHPTHPDTLGRAP